MTDCSTNRGLVLFESEGRMGNTVDSARSYNYFTLSFGVLCMEYIYCCFVLVMKAMLRKLYVICVNTDTWLSVWLFVYKLAH